MASSRLGLRTGSAPRAGIGVGLLGGALMVAACAHVESPPGGPEDTTAPRVVETYPDSGAVRVPLTDSLVFVFSEAMNQRTVETAFSISPAIEQRERRWDGTRWFVRLEQPLDIGQTYVVSFGTEATDRRKIPLVAPWAIGFSTAAELDTGALRGTVIGSRFAAKDVALYLWPWEEAPPDTSIDGFPPEPLRVGQTDAKGAFALDYLPRGRALRLAAFYDRNRDRRHDPADDFWGFLPDPVTLSDSTTRLDGVSLYIAARDEPGTVSGSVSDSLCLASTSRRRLEAARAERDSLRLLLQASDPGLDEATLRALVKRFAESDAELPKLTGQDSLRIGSRLIELDAAVAAAKADSSFCAQPIPVQLLGPEGEVVRSATGPKFSWSDVPPGIYRLRTFRDLNGNAVVDSAEVEVRFPHAIEVQPLRVLDQIELALPAEDTRIGEDGAP
ncbi:MAG: Ig-like domain-containing protein [Candidatus Eisenbacteria bacterium]|nr:Ig-like domain-containing protein [Candidatus Eisenbacteria bacterium]